MMRLDDNLFIMFREEWDDSGAPRLGGGDDPQGGRRFIRLEEREGLVEHHTVTIDTDATRNIWEWVEQEIVPHMRRLRVIRPDLGLDVPYNWCKFCMPGGRLVVCEGRGNIRSGAHTFPYGGYSYNIKRLGNAWVGNFEDFATNINPWIPANNLFNGWLKYDVGMRNLGPIDLHGLISGASTACPGYHVIRKRNKMVYTRPKEEDMAIVLIKASDSNRTYVTDWVHKRWVNLESFRLLQYAKVPLIVVTPESEVLDNIPDATED